MSESQFHTLELIGSGSFGKVYKGRRKGTAEIVALKFIPKRSRTTKELQVLHHLSILQNSWKLDSTAVLYS